MRGRYWIDRVNLVLLHHLFAELYVRHIEEQTTLRLNSSNTRQKNDIIEHTWSALSFVQVVIAQWWAYSQFSLEYP